VAGARPDLERVTLKGLADIMNDAWAGYPTARPSAAEILQRLEEIRSVVKDSKKKAATRGNHAGGKCSVQ